MARTPTIEEKTLEALISKSRRLGSSVANQFCCLFSFQFFWSGGVCCLHVGKLAGPGDLRRYRTQYRELKHLFCCVCAFASSRLVDSRLHQLSVEVCGHGVLANIKLASHVWLLWFSASVFLLMERLRRESNRESAPGPITQCLCPRSFWWSADEDQHILRECPS